MVTLARYSSGVPSNPVVDRYLDSFINPGDLVELDQDEDVFDPLPPADESVVGLEEVERRLRDAKRIAIFPDEEALAPTSVTREQAQAFLDRVRARDDLPMLVARIKGADFVIPSLEVFPRRSGRGLRRRPLPSGPRSPTGS